MTLVSSQLRSDITVACFVIWQNRVVMSSLGSTRASYMRTVILRCSTSCLMGNVAGEGGERGCWEEVEVPGWRTGKERRLDQPMGHHEWDSKEGKVGRANVQKCLTMASRPCSVAPSVDHLLLVRVYCESACAARLAGSETGWGISTISLQSRGQEQWHLERLARTGVASERGAMRCEMTSTS